MLNAALFSGRSSVRVPQERLALWLCIAAAPVALAVIGAVFPTIKPSQFVLLVVGAMVYVSIARGRLLGSSVRIDARQFPEIYSIVRDTAARLGVPAPQIFVRDDVFVPIVASGIGEPYALIISSQYLEHLQHGELAFLAARELGHIAAGHTRITSLLSTSGRENPIVALIFGAWLRRCEYTADRVGMLCGASLEQAIGAISITTFHAIGRRVDMTLLAEQRRDLEAEPTLRMGEWLSGEPYATNRIERLRAFAQSELAAFWRAELSGPRTAPAVAPDAEREPATVQRTDCAPLPRRLSAVAIDFAVLSAILNTSLGARLTRHAIPGDAPPLVRAILNKGSTLLFDPGTVFSFFAFFVYSAILVGLTGQTLGMVVMQLRVVTTRFDRAGLAQVAWRYFAAFVASISSIALFGFFFRVQPHDRISGTRLVLTRKARA
jgi:Zn-dependent protease with chaperone function/uncharacterized RDD family membrane protein YckC